jgi:predicted amidophosphoribosyltransferase
LQIFTNANYSDMTIGDNNASRQQQQRQQQTGRSATIEQTNSGCQCPACGNAVSITADICERCGQWLLESTCCFCYSEVKPGQKFCRECGNPPLGITCPQCNTFSHFDFCPNCNTALSKRASPYLEAFRQSEAFAELVQLSKFNEASQPTSVAKKTENTTVSQLDQLKAYLDQFQKSSDKKQSPGFAFNYENADASEALEKASLQEKTSQQPDSAAAELELMKRIALLQQKTFADNQSARMFYTAIKVLLPEVMKTKQKRITGWLCNFAGVVHAAPHECSEPNLGGEWQYETYTTYETTYIEH